MRLKVSNVCQLYAKNIWKEYTDLYGVSIKNNNDGSITLNGTATESFYYTNILDYEIKPNHVYFYFDAYNEESSWSTYVGGCEGKLIDASGAGGANYAIYNLKREGTIEKARPDLPKNLLNTFCGVYKGFTLNNVTIKPQLFDLTEMYGAGNEPTTVEQFRQDFPNEMYEYSPVCWKKFRRLKYIANKEPVQLLDKSKYHGSSTFEGVTFTNNGDGTWTVVGTAPDVPANKEYVQLSIIVWNLEFSKKHFIPGHKIVVAGGVSMDSAGKSAVVQWIWGWTGGYDAANSWEPTVHTIRQYPEDKLLEYSNYIELRVYAGATVNFTFKPQFFDLTEMYGAGNEPATVAQFRADFPNELYDYNLYNYLTLNRGKYIANKEPVQLLDKSKYPATITNNGVTFTNNGNGTITLNGTNTGGGRNLYTFMNVSVKARHYYYIYSGQAGTWETCMFTVDKSISADRVDGHIGFQGAHSFDNCAAYLFIGAGATFNNYVVKPQFFDLTEMYGAGNEPTTVAQFRADFPNELYDYNPYNAITFR